MPPSDTPQHESAAPWRCQSCETTLETPLACSACHSIFPVPADASHFTRLGIPEQFDVDLGEAEQRFITLSRELHPDFFTTRPEHEQALSLELSAHLNEAINVIRDPFRRAAYLLERWAPQETAARDQAMPAGFLEEVLLLREEIDELRDETPSPERDAEVDRLRDDLLARREALLADLGIACGRLEAARTSGADFTETITECRRILNAARYVTGTLHALRDAPA